MTQSLITRLREATEPSKELDILVYHALGRKITGLQDTPFVFQDGSHIQEITASLDAALALVAEVLPGWVWGRYPELNTMFVRNLKTQARVDGEHKSPVIALLIALIQAQGAQE